MTARMLYNSIYKGKARQGQARPERQRRISQAKDARARTARSLSDTQIPPVSGNAKIPPSNPEPLRSVDSGMAPKESQQQQSPAEVAAPAARSIPDEARRLLHELAAAWEDVAGCGPREPEVVPLKGAMTNEVYRARWATGSGDSSAPGQSDARTVLVRVYGEGVDLFFDREDEVRTFEFMSRHGHGPRLLGRFPNGRVEEFIHARVRIRFLHSSSLIFFIIDRSLCLLDCSDPSCFLHALLIFKILFGKESVSSLVLVLWNPQV